MYAYLNGTVVQKAANYLVIDVGGVGYRVFADNFTLNALKTDHKEKIYTYLKVAEDDMSLFGFHTMEQKTMFEKLISVSGIGPKVAMSVLSTMRVNDVAAAVISGDSKAFVQVPGIGAKVAQRLVLELKEKVDFDTAVGDGGEFMTAGQDAAQEAAAALLGLGYNRQEALAAVNAVKNLGDTPEELVLLALKRLDQ